MKKVTGIGGIFFRCADVETTKAWYKRHLGLDVDQYGCTFKQRVAVDIDENATQQWSPFPHDTSYIDNPDQQFMINYKVENLTTLVALLIEEGVEIMGTIEGFDYGLFACIKDCDGRKLELWQPKNEVIFNK
ncbi:MAG: VOC family protein [Nonlabens sp.]